MKLTMIQALRMLKTLREEQVKAADDISKSIIPTTVDGVRTVSKEREDKAVNNIQFVEDITSDIVTLRDAIDQSNESHGLNRLANEMQELRKLDSRLERDESYIMGSDGRITISDNGNLIEHELLGKDEYKKLRQANKVKINELQDTLDKANSENTIEVELKTRQ